MVQMEDVGGAEGRRLGEARGPAGSPWVPLRWIRRVFIEWQLVVLRGPDGWGRAVKRRRL